MKKPVENHYLDFTKKEKNGIACILVLILFVIFIPRLYLLFFPQKNPPAQNLQKEMALLETVMDSNTANYQEEKYKSFERPFNRNKQEWRNENTGKALLFEFDPNTISFEDWKKLGLKEKTITTIQKYLSKGGRFRNPGDIKNIWGIPPGLSDKLLPYVRIKETVHPVFVESKFDKPTFKSFEKTIININEADSAAFEQLPGIGAKLSSRIISFRSALGGFYSVNQVAETFGLPDSTFKKILDRLTVQDGYIKKININTATLDEMKGHPYIRYKLANAIVQYRDQHGKFARVDDIKKMMLVDEGLFNKLSPYLATE